MHNKKMSQLTGQQHREIFHLLFLDRLLKISDPKLYVLKGGVNLRFYFLSQRYSEDMDIDVLGGGVSTLKKNGYKILNDASFLRALRVYGIDELLINDPSKAKQTATTQRFRVRLVTTAGLELPTRVEFSRRTEVDSKAVLRELVGPKVVEPYRILSFFCQHYSGLAAGVQKVVALGNRTEVQARDVYDLFTLYLGGHVTRDAFQKLATDAQRSKAIAALDSLDFDAYKGQVVEYLEPPIRKAEGSRQAWVDICKTVKGLLL